MSNWLRASSKAGKPHSYSASFAASGLWAPVSRATPIGRKTKAADRPSAMTRKIRIGRYCVRSTMERCSPDLRSEEHTSELQSLMRISYAVFCLKKKKAIIQQTHAQQLTTNTTDYYNTNYSEKVITYRK